MGMICSLTTDDAGYESRLRELLAGDEFFWLDMHDPTDEQIAGVGALLDWHPLLSEDIEHGRQRAKVDDFPDQSLIIAYAAFLDGPDDRLRLRDIAIVVHGNYVVTVQREPLPELERLHEYAAHGLDISEAALVHRVLDIIVDTTTAATAALATEVDHLEQVVEFTHTPEDLLQHLRACRRDIVRMRSVATAQSDALGLLDTALGRLNGFEFGLRDHFRDVYDHAKRVVDELEIGRALLDGAFEAYYTMLVARQGAVGQRLTVVSTIFLPLTFVTGFFGQNFGWMVDNVSQRHDFLIWGVGATGLTALALAVLFRRLRWW